MNWEEYLVLSEKTLSRQFNCEEQEQLFLHSVIGTLTEIEELLQCFDKGELLIEIQKQGSIAEETADAFWYLAILFRELNLDMEENPFAYAFGNCGEISYQIPFELLLELTKTQLQMLDMLKKKIYYNKDINMVQFINLTFKSFSVLKEFCKCYQTNIEVILEKNINKLRARYGEEFSSERAINRDLDNEKNILENE